MAGTEWSDDHQARLIRLVHMNTEPDAAKLGAKFLEQVPSSQEADPRPSQASVQDWIAQAADFDQDLGAWVAKPECIQQFALQEVTPEVRQRLKGGAAAGPPAGAPPAAPPQPPQPPAPPAAGDAHHVAKPSPEGPNEGAVSAGAPASGGDTDVAGPSSGAATTAAANASGDNKPRLTIAERKAAAAAKIA
eukprot:CAMPEP_0202359222 /NCGR_PEP_ID=MMETSP1126-20121109/12597_1 /ASSEMBLY_ACC=CAM_ASM_000457 /TAXON_ID=3047 /ORGANISM="Dunaliella tertiolecta, Strain CCMP1320" /LENGTH=190 /DNA_ID=CAMNT_0048952583 /DNA_START=78 /DNA_END=647 /DNA_ORIENTATION=-